MFRAVQSGVFVAVVCALVGCGGDELGENESDARKGGKHATDAAAPVELEPVADASPALPVEGDAGAPDAAPADAAADSAADASSPVADAAAEAAAPGQPVEPVKPAPCSVYYRDADGDGYGAPDSALTSCTKPDGYVSNADDCYDGQWAAYPGGRNPAAEHRGDGSFDYDCDGVETVMRPKLATCPVFTEEQHACPPPTAWKAGERCDYDGIIRAANWQEHTAGWVGTVPGCGQPGTYGANLQWDNTARRYTCTLELSQFRQLKQACY